jgi:hypothetical protein
MRGAAWNCWLNLHRRFSRLRYAYGREWLQCRELQVSRYCVSLIDASWNSFAVLHCWNYCNNVFITAFRVKDASRLARSTQAGTVQSCPEHSTDCAELVSLHRALQLSSRFIMTRRRFSGAPDPGRAAKGGRRRGLQRAHTTDRIRTSGLCLPSANHLRLACNMRPGDFDKRDQNSWERIENCFGCRAQPEASNVRRIDAAPTLEATALAVVDAIHPTCIKINRGQRLGQVVIAQCGTSEHQVRFAGK